MAILARPGFPHIAPAVEASSPSKIDATSVAVVDEVKARLTMLYSEHGSRIHRFLRDLLCDATLAADATQETFVRAYRRLPEMTADESETTATLAPWLFGIARNVSLEMRRARMRANRHLDLDSPASMKQHEAPARGSPESEYLGREALHVVNAALDELSEERRAMLLLRLDHGLSYDDIATAMGFTLAKVKVEIHRAREVLRATMSAYESGMSGSSSSSSSGRSRR